MFRSGDQLDYKTMSESVGNDEILPVPELTLDSDEFDESDDDEGVFNEPTICLFCEVVSTNISAAMTHVEKEHGVSFVQLKKKFNCDQYSFIKLINYIRYDGITAEELLQTKSASLWQDEKYLKPKEYEPWLTYDYDSLSTEASETQKCDQNETDLHLHDVIAALECKIKQQDLLLQQCSEDMKKMREGFQRLVEKTDSSSEGNGLSQNCVASQSLNKDESYFSSYAHFGIHHEMLSDEVRTNSYRDAILKNAAFIRGKDVLDVGCGTSILSIFASQAGAKSVVGIDNSDIIYNAMDIIKRNNIPNVTLMKGRLEDTLLPQEKYDVIISEWMGYFLLFEGMLDSVIYARDHHLKPDGVLLPNRCTMSIIGYGSDALFNSHVNFWNNVYGLDMSNMRKEVMHEPLIDIVDPQHILTEPNIIADLNLLTVDLNYSNFVYDFELKCSSAGNLSAFVGYFDSYFTLQESIMFSTSPRHSPTHWKQVVFFMEQIQPIKVNDVIRGTLTCKRSRNNARSLDITIEAFGHKQKYYLD